MPFRIFAIASNLVGGKLLSFFMHKLVVSVSGQKLIFVHLSFVFNKHNLFAVAIIYSISYFTNYKKGSDHMMKNWEDMRDYSYVEIKLKRTKNLNEGLMKCNIQRLTRRNPVYQHIKLHTLQNKLRKVCQSCIVIRKDAQKVPYPITINANLSYHMQTLNSQSIQDLILVKTKIPKLTVKLSHSNKYQSMTSFRKHTYPNLRQQALNKVDMFKSIIQKFDDSMMSIRTRFKTITQRKQQMMDYFVTNAKQIQQEINEDRGLSIAEVQSDIMIMRQSIFKQEKRRIQRDKEIIKMNEPIQFPFSNDQIKHILDKSIKPNQKESIKTNKMISSLYEYKSSKMKHSHKMQLIRKTNDTNDSK